MTPERWRQVRQLVQSALERPPEDRESYLEAACAGDLPLRQEVESQLAERNGSEPPSNSPAPETAHRAPVRNSPPEPLPDLSGRTLLQYDLTETIGKGGMGVVYKAHDRRLDRTVAIKVLPGKAVADAEQRRRFFREARVSSSLSHPHIVRVHDIQEDDGMDFIVMEYVTGKTLSDYLDRRKLPLGEALKFAVQIADALAAAHEAGIVHRDLKPSNIMITDRGEVKVLDFGLAKLIRLPAGTDSGISSFGKDLTREGSILGTAAYMSPEQAEGKPVDMRTDIFSFGSLLYEMATGRRAFAGDSFISTLAAVVQKDPIPPSELAADIPPVLEKTILRCLRKDTARRWQHMQDVRIELEELLAEIGSLPGSGRWPSARARRIGWWAALLLLASAAAAAAWFWRTLTESEPPAPRVTVLTSDPGSETFPSFSPDGNQLAFAWNGEQGDNTDIYVKVVGESYALRLTTDPLPDTYPAWSPDGKQIAFYRTGEGKGGIYAISPLGGQERKISDFQGVSLSWTPDGEWLATAKSSWDAADRQEGSGLYLIPVEGGRPRQITVPGSPQKDWHPAVSPDGRRLAFTRCPMYPVCDIYCLDLSPDGSALGKARRLTQQYSFFSGVAWSPDSESVIYSASRFVAMKPYLWRVGKDGRNPQRLEYAGPYASQPAVARSGNRLAFSFNKINQDQDIWCYREGEAPRPFIVSSLREFSPAYSPDGTKIVFASDRAGESADIWLAHADGSAPVQMTFIPKSSSGCPQWSPDGKFLLFDLNTPDGEVGLGRVKAAGGPVERVTSDPNTEVNGSYSPDGKWIYFRSERSGTSQIWRMPAAGGKAEQITRHGADYGQVSMDGRTLYYTGWGPGLRTVPVAGGTPAILDPFAHRRAFAVRTEGIYYIRKRPQEVWYELVFLDLATSEKRVLTRLDGPIFQGLAVSPDRKTFLYSRYEDPNIDLMLVENFR